MLRTKWVSVAPRATAFLLMIAFSAVESHADVVHPAPNRHTVEQSDLIVVGRLTSVSGAEPYRHSEPPALSFRVRRLLKGTVSRPRFEVVDWISAGPPTGDGPFPASAEAVAQWGRSEVEVPEAGEAVLLFLKRVEGRYVQVKNGYGAPVYLVAPSDWKLNFVEGLVGLRYEFDAPRGLWVLTTSGATVVHGHVENVSETTRTFRPSQILLWIKAGPRRSEPECFVIGMTWVGRAEACTVGPFPGGQAMRLQPGERRSFRWDLRDMVPFDEPGRYQIMMIIPAAGEQIFPSHSVRIELEEG